VAERLDAGPHWVKIVWAASQHEEYPIPYKWNVTGRRVNW
jgi:hypothetical protein